GPQLLDLVLPSLRLLLPEFGHDLAGEQLERFADVVVPVLAALLDEDRLIHAGVLEEAQRLAKLSGSADAPGALAQHLGPDLIAHGQILVPDVVRPGVCVPKT